MLPQCENRNKNHRCWWAYCICGYEKRNLFLIKIRLPGISIISTKNGSNFIHRCKEHRPGLRKFEETNKQKICIHDY